MSILIWTALAAGTIASDAVEKKLAMPETVAKDAKLEEVYADDWFFEGPTWDPKTGKLYFTAFGKDSYRVMRLDEPGKAAVWMDKSQGINGTFFSLDGRLLGAQVFAHRIVSLGFGKDGPEDAKTLYDNPKLHQPNDVCQTPNGDIYFTDPDFKDKKASGVYRLDKEGKAAKIIDDMAVPNGLIASLDGKTLYVGDSDKVHWKSYPIREDGSVGAGKVFFDPKVDNRDAPDGMSIDEHGNLYFSGRGGVWVVNPEGKSLGLIPVDVFCSNVSFGGKDGNELYLTCSKKVYRLKMNVRGGQFTRKEKS